MNVTFTPATLTVEIGTESLSVSTGSQVVKEYVEVETYDGEYEVTPSDQPQELNTAWLRMTQNVVINPIPSNWGRITWNGAVLTVS